MARLLYLTPGPVPPSPDPDRAVYFHFGTPGRHTVDVLCPVWWRSNEEGLAQYPGSDFPTVRLGPVTYHFELEYQHSPALRSLARIRFYLRKGTELGRQGPPIDAIICYGTNSVGLAAILLARRLGAALIPEIPGVPDKAFVLDSPRPTLRNRLRRAVSLRLLRAALDRAAALHTLYEGQLPPHFGDRVPVRRVSHSFVPIGLIPRSTEDERFVLFLGFPWYLKGVDLLIAAFRQIADQVPDVTLRVVGHFPDREALERQTAGHPRISIEKAVKAPVAHDLVSRCSVLVLPSRTEAMGRVLLEAMAAGKPVVASRVDGIPHYVTDGENGLLFACGDSHDLARQLLRVLTDPALARRLGETGHARVRAEWSEQRFQDVWEELIDAALQARRAGR
ncbi:MAG: glycosyltransferase family 4 protein [Acidobacteria bacterium]|nr:glycosyltransferase family 4 protein [Acidobacteriota bacterium]